MARISNFLIALWRWILGGLLFSIAVNLGSNRLQGNVTIDPTAILLVQRFGTWMAVGFGILLLLTGISWILKRRQEKQARLHQVFSLFEPVQKLTPEDLYFQMLEPGQSSRLDRRTFYPTYFPREAVEYDHISEPNPGQSYSEDDLTHSLREGKGFVLIGQPYDGKSRTIYQTIK